MNALSLYDSFLASKRKAVQATGQVILDGDIHPMLFPFQGYVSLRTGRRFVGCELKPRYFAAAVKNLERAGFHGQAGLFDETEEVTC